MRKFVRYFGETNTVPAALWNPCPREERREATGWMKANFALGQVICHCQPCS